jgi:glycosyltransferase involved in cell wall biosynthesis
MSKQFALTKLAERLTFGHRARAFMLRERFDIVHIQKPYDLPPGAWFKRGAGSKLVFGCHGTDFFPGDRQFVGASDIAVSCSAFNAGQVKAHYHISPRVVYNGIDPQLFAPLPVDTELKEQSAGGDQTILYVGRLVRWKGVQYLVEATARLAQMRPVRLLIAGEGEYRETLARRAHELGIAERVRFLGYIAPETLPSYYALADIVALASYANETFSIAAAEAMACERPVVGSRFGGIPEVIADGETGLLADPENASDLADKIGRLLDAPTLREQFGQCGRQRVLKHFTWDVVTDRVQAAYATLGY